MPTLAAWCHQFGRSRQGANDKIAQRGLSLVFAAAFLAVAGKTAYYAAATQTLPSLASASPAAFGRARPDIVDRNGRILATDIRVFWLYANPQHMIAADDAAEKVTALFRDLDRATLAAKFRDKASRFEWVKRGLTPKQAEAVFKLGIPGFYLVPALGRVYPAGNAASHILGVANIDNGGMSGIEKYIDDHLADQMASESLSDRPVVKLSLDLGVQHTVASELAKAKERYHAKAAMGVVLDVDTGEVIASASLPDFDPNKREEAVAQDRQNRVVSDTYELGSVFKMVTVAMAIDQGLVSQTDQVDARPIHAGRFLLRDKHAKTAALTVEDIFIHSSNTGAARLALMAGLPQQRLFLKKLGLFERLETEAGSSPPPSVPKVWRTSNSITAAYGHGIAVPPLLFASAAASLVNGGRAIKPTFLLNSAGDEDRGEQVVKPETSAAIRDLMRQTVQRGTGRLAAVPGFAVGGKTGTALKVKDGRYSPDVLNSFVAAFPIGQPRYLVMVTLDEPQPERPGASNEASNNAAPLAGAIVARIASLLNILPTARFDEARPTSYENTSAASLAKPRSRKTSHEIGGVGQRHPATDRARAIARSRDFWSDER